jgi:hypothetical protein
VTDVPQPSKPVCGIGGCGCEAVASVDVRCTLWFATHSDLAADNGEEPHWHVGGYIEPVPIHAVMHVCAHHTVAVEVSNDRPD